MGYAKVSQVTRGIHTRQYSRAFVVSDNSSRVALVSIDSGMVSHIVKMEVSSIRQLQKCQINKRIIYWINIWSQLSTQESTAIWWVSRFTTLLYSTTYPWLQR
ncbi:hypothetical protein AVEN_123306-1 [Araneus ventricosus]|uniref:Neutral ceramidase n=1 Tax=Araneus ventricosus TaxID=182803 RepID=A0A4Y2W332_ARAVE|nr:hypothetical protein AVEN_123306-1 [Araneus ventricosus]